MSDSQEIKILVVEDTPLCQRVMGLSIKAAGYLYDIASTGDKALELFFQNHYDIIFMDVGLPDISGLEVAAKIRKFSVEIPIIVLTAYSDDIYKSQAQQLALDDFVIKPITAETCAVLINQFVCKKKCNSPLLKNEKKIVNDSTT